MGITRNPDHFIRDYHRPSVNIETVILYFQTVNGIINRSHSYYKNWDTGSRQLQTVMGTSVTKVSPLQWLKVTNQTHSYYNDSRPYSSNFEQSMNKINLLEGLQENSLGKLQGFKDMCLLEFECS